MNYYTSDLHLGHANILDYEESRWNFIGISQQDAITSYCRDNKIDLEELSESWNHIKSEVNNIYTKVFIDKIIKTWNKRITNQDDIYMYMSTDRKTIVMFFSVADEWDLGFVDADYLNSASNAKLKNNPKELLKVYMKR